MRAMLSVCVAGWLCAHLSVYGQGQFLFNNRIPPDVDARFVLSTDPPGISSVGLDFQVQLFGGPAGTPIDLLQPLQPPTTSFRGAAGTGLAGYVQAQTVKVPGVPDDDEATILVRVFDSPSWDRATYRFEGVYAVQTVIGLPPPLYIPLGTSPLILFPVPEPSTLALLMLAGAAMVILNNSNQPMKRPNQPDAVNPAIAPRFHVVSKWRGVTDPHRSAK